MNLRLLVVICSVLGLMPTHLLSQNFVYPVGNANERPTSNASNANGYQITQRFLKIPARHSGVDLANGTEGGEVRSIGDGTVTIRRATAESNGWGNVLLIRHTIDGQTFYSLYGHLQEGSVFVNEGDPVIPGQPIGRVDCTGNSYGQQKCRSNNGSGPHLHFAVKKNNRLGCAYLRPDACPNNADTSDNYLPPLQFIADHRQTSETVSANCFCVRFQNGQYWVEGEIADSGELIQSATITGSKISGSVPFAYNLYPNQPGKWWTNPNIFISENTPPNFPLNYTILINYKNGTSQSISKTVLTWEWAE